VKIAEDFEILPAATLDGEELRIFVDYEVKYTLRSWTSYVDIREYIRSDKPEPLFSHYDASSTRAYLDLFRSLLECPATVGPQHKFGPIFCTSLWHQFPYIKVFIVYLKQILDLKVTLVM
jgi:hypothetical protein